MTERLMDGNGEEEEVHGVRYEVIRKESKKKMKDVIIKIEDDN